MELKTMVCAAAVAVGAVAANAAAYQVQQDVKIGAFWGEKYKLLTTKWLPHCYRQMEAGGAGEEHLNLVHAADYLRAKADGDASFKPKKFKGCDWADAYPYNIVESTCLALEIDPGDDAELKAAHDWLSAKLEEWIPTILAAQEPSGYIHTMHTLRDWPHFQKTTYHEFYVMGYFIEMGIAHHRMTKGKDRRLFDAAIRCADHLDSVFGPEPKRTWMNGHPGLEYALCRLADATGDVKYARLAHWFVTHQHTQSENQRDYNQAERPAVEMKDATGHAVRAVYFYSAMTGLGRRLGDTALAAAGDRLFDSVLNRKYYLTGGVGASTDGNEAFGPDYDLPETGYCEACASCGLDFWCRELRALHGGDLAVADMVEAVRERAAYNILLGAISRDGLHFFYQNPLRSVKVRYPWHVCPCCVGNVPRTLFALKDGVFSVEGDTLYINQYMDIENAKVTVGGTEYAVSLKTDYPASGKVRLATDAPVKVVVRFPNRMESALYTATPETEHGYREVGERGTGNGERGTAWELPLPEQTVTADAKVKGHALKVAFQRGPVVYSWEGEGFARKVPNYDRLNDGGESTVWKNK